MQKNHHIQNRAVRFGSMLLFIAAISLVTPIPAKAAPTLSQTKEMKAAEKQISETGGVCTPVKGKDFTWCIPIHIHNVSQRATEVYVSCSANDRSHHSITSTGIHIPLHNGSYDGIVKAATNFIDISHHSAPATWECHVRLLCGHGPTAQDCSAAEGLTRQQSTLTGNY